MAQALPEDPRGQSHPGPHAPVFIRKGHLQNPVSRWLKRSGAVMMKTRGTDRTRIPGERLPACLQGFAMFGARRRRFMKHIG